MTVANERSLPGGSEFFTRGLADADPEIFSAIGSELRRQQEKIELISSRPSRSNAPRSCSVVVSPMSNRIPAAR